MIYWLRWTLSRSSFSLRIKLRLEKDRENSVKFRDSMQFNLFITGDF